MNQSPDELESVRHRRDIVELSKPMVQKFVLLQKPVLLHSTRKSPFWGTGYIDIQI